MPRFTVAASLCLGAFSWTCHGFQVAPFTRRNEHGRWNRHESVMSSAKDNDQVDARPSHPLLLPVVSAMLSAMVFVSSAQALDASVYNHDYSDPFHPLCERKVQVSADGTTFHYSGTAVGPKDDPVRRGCSADEIAQYTLRQGAFDGVILSNGVLSAGDGVHEGVWEPAGSATTNLGYENVDGIRWNDGNKWVVKNPEPSTSTVSQESSTTALVKNEEPSTVSEEPSITLSEEPSTEVTEEPSITLSEESSAEVKTEEPEVKAEEPSTPLEEPSTAQVKNDEASAVPSGETSSTEEPAAALV